MSIRIYDVSSPGAMHGTLSASSGEAEIHGIAAGMAQALGLQALAKDLGFHVAIDVLSDATAAIGKARRRGMGKCRHLKCTDLWVQEKIRSKQISLEKMPGTENPADMLTKCVDHATLTAALEKTDMKIMSGRPNADRAAMGIHSQTPSTQQYHVAPMILSTCLTI